MKYDQLQKQKEEIIKPVEPPSGRLVGSSTSNEPEIVKPIEKEIIKPVEPEVKTNSKKKRIIKKIVYEDGSEDEIEDLRHVQPQPQQQPNNNRYMKMFSNDDSYSNSVYQSACDKLKEKVQDERTKYLIKSLMPNYG